MKTILYLTSAICFAIATSHAASTESHVLLDQRVSGEHSLSVSGIDKENAASASVAVEFDDQPIVSGFSFTMDSELGTLALCAGFVGMTFVMIRHRQAS